MRSLGQEENIQSPMVRSWSYDPSANDRSFDTVPDSLAPSSASFCEEYTRYPNAPLSPLRDSLKLKIKRVSSSVSNSPPLLALSKGWEKSPLLPKAQPRFQRTQRYRLLALTLLLAAFALALIAIKSKLPFSEPFRASGIPYLPDASDFAFARVYRILGNDLPPRHQPGQTLQNLQFLLENEPNLELSNVSGQDLQGYSPRVEKWWVLNRIVSKETESRIIALLKKHRQQYFVIPFDERAYKTLQFETEADFPTFDFFHSAAFLQLGTTMQKRAYDHVYSDKNQYVMNNNGGRNAALAHGLRRARWVFPLDGNCFFSKRGWAAVARDLTSNGASNKYLVIPMVRLTKNSNALDESRSVNATEEPQVAFRNDALFKFDEQMRYGRRSKLELLWRLSKAFNKSTTANEPVVMQRLFTIESSFPWETKPNFAIKSSATKNERWAYSGHVYRLFSGDAEQERPTLEAASRRAMSRTVGVHKLINHLDRAFIESFQCEREPSQWWSSNFFERNSSQSKFYADRARQLFQYRVESVNGSKKLLATTIGDKSPKFLSEGQILAPNDDSDSGASLASVQNGAPSTICRNTSTLRNGTLLTEPMQVCFNSLPPSFPTFIDMVTRLSHYVQALGYSYELVEPLFQHYHARLAIKIEEVDTFVKGYLVDGSFEYAQRATSLIRRWFLRQASEERLLGSLPLAGYYQMVQTEDRRLSRKAKWDLALLSSTLLSFDISKIVAAVELLYREAETITSLDLNLFKTFFATLQDRLRQPSLGLIATQSSHVIGLGHDRSLLSLSHFLGDYYVWRQTILLSLQPRVSRLYLQDFTYHLAPLTLGIASETALRQVENSINYMQLWVDLVDLVDMQYGIASASDYIEATEQLGNLYTDLWTIRSKYPTANNVSLSCLVLEFLSAAASWSRSTADLQTLAAKPLVTPDQGSISIIRSLRMLYQSIRRIESRRMGFVKRETLFSKSFSLRSFDFLRDPVHANQESSLDSNYRQFMDEDHMARLNDAQNLQLSRIASATRTHQLSSLTRTTITHTKELNPNLFQ